MSVQDIIRAWKDAEFRASLSEEQLKQLPAHPAGRVELEDAELDAAGGALPTTQVQWCTNFCTMRSVCSCSDCR